MCVLYTTDGWATTNVANSLFYGAKPAYILTNSSSANTVIGHLLLSNLWSGLV